MVARSKALRKRPISETAHRCLDDLAHYKQLKIEAKPTVSVNNSEPSTSNHDFEDLEKEVPSFGKMAVILADSS